MSFALIYQNYCVQGEEQESTIGEEEKHEALTRSLGDSLRMADFTDLVHY